MPDVLVNPSDIAPPGTFPIDRDPEMATPKPKPKPKPADDNIAQLFDPPKEPEAPRPAAKYQGASGRRRYSLLFPVTIDRKPFKVVEVSPPTLFDVQDWIDGKMASHFEMVARMCGMTAAQLGTLRWPDVQALLDLTQSMLPLFIREAIEAQASAK